MKPSAFGDAQTSPQKLTFVAWTEIALQIYNYLMDCHEIRSQVPITASIHSIPPIFFFGCSQNKYCSCRFYVSW